MELTLSMTSAYLMANSCLGVLLFYSTVKPHEKAYEAHDAWMVACWEEELVHKVLELEHYINKLSATESLISRGDWKFLPLRERYDKDEGLLAALRNQQKPLKLLKKGLIKDVNDCDIIELFEVIHRARKIDGRLR